MSAVVNRKNELIQDPPFVQKLFADPRAGWFWLIVRLWVGYKWIDASLHKIDNEAWVSTGMAVKGFWESAVLIPEVGRPAISFDWYRSFLQILLDAEAYTWMAPLIAYGELLIGVALILGAFTGIAAFFGALLNWNFMMAGTASSNPMLFIAAIGLMFAWKVAGYYGLDYFLLRWIGTPWRTAPQSNVDTAAAGAD
ncbi:MAG: DoxX family membrane protein [Caldilineaceae bacterium]|nr:DoxX family membrane protein [Caldilineaceae bacterium]